MITYFPKIYPDELVYSWFCRYYIHSGCISHKIALKNLMFGESDAPSKEFIGHLNDQAFNTINRITPIEDLIMNHTMYPEYVRFLPYDKKINSLKQITNNKPCDPHQIMTILPRDNENEIYLKYCPKCVSEDRSQYGETYWHRSHQVRGIDICTKHLCKLEQSHVKCTNDKSFVFYPAESSINEKNDNTNIDIEENINYQKSSFEKYLVNVFNKKIVFNSKNIKYGHIINYYIYKNDYAKGNSRCVQKLYDDMKSFYLSIKVNKISSFHQLQRVLSDKQYEFYTICQIAYFLGIREDELLSPSREILQWVLVSTKEKNIKRKDSDWNKFDDETIPWFENFVRNVYFGKFNKNERPGFVSEKIVCEKLKVSPNGLKKMPKCYSVYSRYKESYEENWARRITWAYKKLLHEKGSNKIYSYDIRKMAGVKEINFAKTYKYWNRYISNQEIIDLKNILSI